MGLCDTKCSATTSDLRHRVAILALPGFVPFDLVIPQALFSQAALADGRKPYEVCFCGPHGAIASSQYAIAADLPLDELPGMDTVVIPGVMDALAFDDAAVGQALCLAAAAGVRLASICTGAFVLAAAGLLGGLRATTHWAMTGELAGRYPDVAVEPDVLFVDNGRILTSAGLASGLDLCLHLIRQDYGAAVAARSADFFVLPIEREGGHAQQIRRIAPQGGENLAALQIWLLENLHGELTLQAIARHACMSPRTLHRKFQEQAGVAPMAWLAGARIRRAQALLETTHLPVEQIAAATGFGSATAFRDRFRRSVGASPTAWRKTYGGAAGPSGVGPAGQAGRRAAG